MDLKTLLYILNSCLIIVHEIESGYEREWEILHLPFRLKGFLIIHIPIIIIILIGVLEIYKFTFIGITIGYIISIGGTLPLVIHKFLFNKENHFNSKISNFIIYSNFLISIILLVLISIKIN